MADEVKLPLQGLDLVIHVGNEVTNTVSPYHFPRLVSMWYLLNLEKEPLQRFGGNKTTH